MIGIKTRCIENLLILKLVEMTRSVGMEECIVTQIKSRKARYLSR